MSFVASFLRCARRLWAAIVLCCQEERSLDYAEVFAARVVTFKLRLFPEAASQAMNTVNQVGSVGSKNLKGLVKGFMSRAEIDGASEGVSGQESGELQVSSGMVLFDSRVFLPQLRGVSGWPALRRVAKPGAEELVCCRVRVAAHSTRQKSVVTEVEWQESLGIRGRGINGSVFVRLGSGFQESHRQGADGHEEGSIHAMVDEGEAGLLKAVHQQDPVKAAIS
eukprot:1763994-Amphidinium_carterae.6